MKLPMKSKIHPFIFLNFKPRKRRFFGRKTVNLSIPQSETSSTKMSHIDEYISSSPTYQTVPDFQRVQITGDYASGVSHSLVPPPWDVAAGKTAWLFQLLTFLYFLLRKVLAHLFFVILHSCISTPMCHGLYFCLAFFIPLREVRIFGAIFSLTNCPLQFYCKCLHSRVLLGRDSRMPREQ